MDYYDNAVIFVTGNLNCKKQTKINFTNICYEREGNFKKFL